MLFRFFFIFAISSAFCVFARADSLVVSSSTDTGPGSLRQAIERANTHPNSRISFAIPTRDASFDAKTRTWTVAPRSPLPVFRGRGTHLEAGGNITISGEHLRRYQGGFFIAAPECIIRGLKWRFLPILLSSSDNRIENNTFEGDSIGVALNTGGKNAQRNRFFGNRFHNIKCPIELRGGANNWIQSPKIFIRRTDKIAPVSHTISIVFQGQPKAPVALELLFSPEEARETPRVDETKEVKTLITNARGEAKWTFEWRGYPAGSWSALATQNGGTSELSNTVVMPYLN